MKNKNLGKTRRRKGRCSSDDSANKTSKTGGVSSRPPVKSRRSGALARILQVVFTAAANSINYIALVVIGLLAIISIVLTVNLNYGAKYIAASEVPTYSNTTNWPIGIVASLVVVVVLFCLIYLCWEHSNRVSEKKLLWGAIAVLSVVQAGLILMSSSNSAHFDSGVMAHVAKLLTSGLPLDWSSDGNIAAKDYILAYPYQSGTILLFTALSKVMQNTAIASVQCWNVVFNAVSLYTIYRIGQLLLINKQQRIILLLLTALCCPLYIYSLFAYGLSFGIMTSLLCLYFGIKAIRALLVTDRHHCVLNLLGVLVCVVLIVWVKSSLIVVYVGLVVVMVLVAIKLRKMLFALVSVAIFVGAELLSPIPQRILESMVGFSLGTNIPKTAWLVIGTSFDSDIGVPGWWSRYAVQLKEKYGNDSEKMRLAARRDLQTQLRDLAGEPSKAIELFTTKVVTEWAEPTFNAWVFATYNVSRVDWTKTGLISTSTSLMDGYQSLIYVAATIGLVVVIRKRHRDYMLLGLVSSCILLSGFSCFLLWEGKSQYVLVYFIILLPLATLGMDSVYNKARHRLLS